MPAEQELPWLPGHAGSVPVRIGNAAHRQRQLDVYGEVMDTLLHARGVGVEPVPDAWSMQRAMLDWLETGWTEPGSGIWEVRGPPRHFTHGKVMAWVAVDRGIREAQRYGLPADLARWSRLRDAIHAEVCERGYDAQRRCFTQYYGSRSLDASLLMIPLVGFLPAQDPRVAGTVAAIERHLIDGGLVRRYDTDAQGTVDGLPGHEGAFLACSFWLADAYLLLGRRREARALFERLLGLANDVGLLSEEYDPHRRRMLGNFPQAFSHVALVNTAIYLDRSGAAADQRGR